MPWRVCIHRRGHQRMTNFLVSRVLAKRLLETASATWESLGRTYDRGDLRPVRRMSLYVPRHILKTDCDVPFSRRSPARSAPVAESAADGVFDVDAYARDVEVAEDAAWEKTYREAHRPLAFLRGCRIGLCGSTPACGG